MKTALITALFTTSLVKYANTYNIEFALNPLLHYCDSTTIGLRYDYDPTISLYHSCDSNFDYDTSTIRRRHDAFDYDDSDRNYDMRSIRLRYDYDPTTTYRTRLLPLDAIRREQKMNMSIFRRSRVVVVSQSNRTQILISITSVVWGHAATAAGSVANGHKITISTFI